MPNQSLVDLTERTATADSDLIHVNSGGSDYKQTKANFTADLAKEISFSTSSTLTSQIDALSPGAYYGFILSYGHQTATGMPYDVNFFVNVQKYDSNNCTVHAIARGTNPRKWTINKANSWGSWIEDPSRDEISALNNSLTKYYDAPAVASVTIGSGGYTELSRPSAVVGKHTLAISVLNWSTASGAFNAAILRDNGTRYMIYGTPNVTITNLELRWVYQD